ncbi:hypothetical protein PENCOP_c001G01726 [Penicillium coprophilum]|uniref:Uncharacterized protein n=1 Tax=Penicillium coprophilum TaxID=36646 RepID=A0A1V6V6B4_9EURO|nr:hypothetical protein PENCOP_c001G01726 [Penicillium coprophilum]
MSSGLPASTLRPCLGATRLSHIVVTSDGEWGGSVITYMAGHNATSRFQPYNRPSLAYEEVWMLSHLSAIPSIGNLGALALDPDGIKTEDDIRLLKWKFNLLVDIPRAG